MRFLIACGGTAGHINPALAVATELRDRYPDSKFLFIGAGRPLENRLIPGAGFEIKNLQVTGFTRSISVNGVKKNVQMLRNLKKANRDISDIIDEFKPDVAFGTGGYVCYPVLSAAAKRHIPTAIHESNAAPGMTTKMLSGKVKMVMAAFPETAEACRDPGRVKITGTPVRKDFDNITKETAKKKLGIEGKPLVVSFWGSLGASKMNEMTADFIKRNCLGEQFYHIHATGGGDKDVANMMDMLRQRGVCEIPQFEDIRPYIEDMGRVMTAADMVICRSGASTTAELTDVGCPSVLVPSPNVTGNHQAKNARAMENAGASKVILEEDCTGDKLYEMAIHLLNDKEKLAKMSADAKAAGRGNAAKEIADILVSFIN